MSIRRPQVDETRWHEVLDELGDRLFSKLEKHGRGACVSLHEIRGLVGEEWDEFKETVHGNDPENARAELFDIAIAAIWGIVSVDEEATTADWDKGQEQ
jgi:nitrogen regulatory protein PII-like uncharacterized protein